MGMFTLLGSPKKKAMIVEPAEGSSFKDLGVELLFKTTAEHSAGNLSVFHYKAPPLFVGPPAHYHKKMHEGFYCLEGTVGIETDGQTAELRAGAYAFVPPMVTHRFWNPTSLPVKFLSIATPGGLEHYFRELQERLNESAVWPPKDMLELVELGERYDTFFGPLADG
jgi:mannose-6-phosphate isomerase-like protein (cupin superfamily)